MRPKHRRHGATLLPFRRLPHAPARRLEIPETPLSQQHTCEHLPLRRTQAHAADPTAGMARWPPPPPPPTSGNRGRFPLPGGEAGTPVSAATPRPSVVLLPPKVDDARGRWRNRTLRPLLLPLPHACRRAGAIYRRGNPSPAPHGFDSLRLGLGFCVLI